MCSLHVAGYNNPFVLSVCQVIQVSFIAIAQREGSSYLAVEHEESTYSKIC